MRGESTGGVYGKEWPNLWLVSGLPHLPGRENFAFSKNNIQTCWFIPFVFLHLHRYIYIASYSTKIYFSTHKMLLVAFNISKSLFFSFTCKKWLLSILMWVFLQVLVGLTFLFAPGYLKLVFWNMFWYWAVNQIFALLSEIYTPSTSCWTYDKKEMKLLASYLLSQLIHLFLQ